MFAENDAASVDDLFDDDEDKGATSGASGRQSPGVPPAARSSWRGR